MANHLSDGPATNSIMPKVIIHVQYVPESIGLDGFPKGSKQACLGKMEKHMKIG